MIRIPPHSEEVERHILGAAMVDQEAAGLAVERLKSSDFYLNRHSEVFSAIRSLVLDSATVDLLSVSERLKRQGKHDAAGGDAYLMAISSEVVSGAGIKEHIPLVLGHSTRRSMIRSLGEAMEMAWDATKPTETALESIQRQFSDLAETGDAERGLKSLPAIFQEAADEWLASASGKVLGIRTGLNSLDEILGGFRPGTLNILAARPGMGKSMLALQIAMACGQPVALYSLEMMATEQAERLIAQRVEGVTPDGLRSAGILQAKQAAIMQALTELKAYPLQICDNSSVTPAQILGQCRRMKRKEGLGMIVVDYLQLVQSAEKHESRVREVGGVSKALKRMANELKVPVLAIASLSRDCEKRDDKRPILADLRESGEIESDAHTVTFIYRHSEYDKAFAKDESLKNVTEVIIRKNRSGRKGTRIFQFDGVRARFYEMDPEDKRHYLDQFKEKKPKAQEQKKGDAWDA